MVSKRGPNPYGCLESNVIAVPDDIMGRSPNTFVSLCVCVCACVRVCVCVSVNKVAYCLKDEIYFDYKKSCFFSALLSFFVTPSSLDSNLDSSLEF